MKTTKRQHCSFAVATPRLDRYEVEYETGLLRTFGIRFRERFGSPATVVLCDERVHQLYGKALARSFGQQENQIRFVVVPDTERSKSMQQYVEVLEELGRMGFDRRGVLINFGGGVICDLGGFVAATYMRGVRYVNLATSMTAQVDAAVGGKVAINTPHAKNLIGAFHHPSYVGGDPSIICTLSERDFRGGIAEAIKMGIITSPELFALLVNNVEAIRSRDPLMLLEVIGLAARLKMDMVAQDPYEEDLRRPLNFGHTLGHPIETGFAYDKVRHGEAVAVGMAVATILSLDRQRIAETDALAIFDLLQAYDLLACTPRIHVDEVIEHLRYIRMIRAGSLHLVLPDAIGRVTITDAVTKSDLIRAFEGYEELCVERGCR